MYEPNNPDWAPSIKLGYNDSSNTSSHHTVERFARLESRKRRRDEYEEGIGDIIILLLFTIEQEIVEHTVVNNTNGDGQTQADHESGRSLNLTMKCTEVL